MGDEFGVGDTSFVFGCFLDVFEGGCRGGVSIGFLLEFQIGGFIFLDFRGAEGFAFVVDWFEGFAHFHGGFYDSGFGGLS